MRRATEQMTVEFKDWLKRLAEDATAIGDDGVRRPGGRED